MSTNNLQISTNVFTWLFILQLDWKYQSDKVFEFFHKYMKGEKLAYNKCVGLNSDGSVGVGVSQWLNSREI